MNLESRAPRLGVPLGFVGCVAWGRGLDCNQLRLPLLLKTLLNSAPILLGAVTGRSTPNVLVIKVLYVGAFGLGTLLALALSPPHMTHGRLVSATAMLPLLAFLKA